MSDEMIAQVSKDAGLLHRITCPPAFAIIGKAPVSPAGFRGAGTTQTSRIHVCRPGCFL
jgi:hypothetical protein